MAPKLAKTSDKLWIMLVWWTAPGRYDCHYFAISEFPHLWGALIVSLSVSSVPWSFAGVFPFISWILFLRLYETIWGWLPVANQSLNHLFGPLESEFLKYFEIGPTHIHLELPVGPACRAPGCRHTKLGAKVSFSFLPPTQKFLWHLHDLLLQTSCKQLQEILKNCVCSR